MYRLELIYYGGNMINNNHAVKIFTIKYYITNSAPNKHNKYFNERNMPLEYFFRWRYGAGFTEDIPFIANKSFIDNFLWGQYD